MYTPKQNGSSVEGCQAQVCGYFKCVFTSKYFRSMNAQNASTALAEDVFVIDDINKAPYTMAIKKADGNFALVEPISEQLNKKTKYTLRIVNSLSQVDTTRENLPGKWVKVVVPEFHIVSLDHTDNKFTRLAFTDIEAVRPPRMIQGKMTFFMTTRSETENKRHFSFSVDDNKNWWYTTQQEGNPGGEVQFIIEKMKQIASLDLNTGGARNQIQIRDLTEIISTSIIWNNQENTTYLAEQLKLKELNFALKKYINEYKDDVWSGVITPIECREVIEKIHNEIYRRSPNGKVYDIDGYDTSGFDIHGSNKSEFHMKTKPWQIKQHDQGSPVDYKFNNLSFEDEATCRKKVIERTGTNGNEKLICYNTSPSQGGASSSTLSHYTVVRASSGKAGGRYASKSGPAAAAKKAASKRFGKTGGTMRITIRKNGTDREFTYDAKRVKLPKPVVRKIAGVTVTSEYRVEVKAVSA